MAKYGDVISYWAVKDQPVSDVLIQPGMLNDSVRVIQEGSKITIKAYINFTGDAANKEIAEGTTYAQAAIDGIMRYWNATVSATKYDSFDVYESVTVQTEVITSDQLPSDTKQRFIDFSISDIKDRAHTRGTRQYSDEENNALFPFIGVGVVPKVESFTYDALADGTYVPSTQSSFGWTAAHEFGHVIGLRDAYKDGIRMNYGEEVNAKSIMASRPGTVTANDIEMLILARRLNEAQSYFYEVLHTRGNPSKTLYHEKSEAVVTEIYPSK